MTDPSVFAFDPESESERSFATRARQLVRSRHPSWAASDQADLDGADLDAVRAYETGKLTVNEFAAALQAAAAAEAEAGKSRSRK